VLRTYDTDDSGTLEKLEVGVGLGHIAASEIDAPNMLVNLL
jgi:hypothetical protein